MTVTRPVAFFDFDGTLTRRDSLMPFLHMVRGTSLFALDLVAASPWLAAYAVRAMRNDRAKEALLGQVLGGKNIDELRKYGEQFANRHISSMLRSQTLTRLRAHQEQGHCCVLISASLDVYLEPWARSIGFDYCLASSLATDENGNVTGKFLGANCFGEEKVKRIQVLLNGIGSPLRTYAYGDSGGDIPMLNFVDEGYQVKKLFGFYRNIIPWCSANHRRAC